MSQNGGTRVRITLRWIQIKDKHSLATSRQARRDVHHRGRLAYATFLIRYCYSPGHRSPSLNSP